MASALPVHVDCDGLRHYEVNERRDDKINAILKKSKEHMAELNVGNGECCGVWSSRISVLPSVTDFC